MSSPKPPTEPLSYQLFSAESATHDLLDAKTEADLIERAQAGDLEARDRLVAANQRLVALFARRYEPYCGNPIELMDLIQWGNEGLIEAIEKFDLTRSLRLSTYAVWKIRRNIRRNALQHSMDFSLSANAAELIPPILRTQIDLSKVLEHPPTAAEIAVKIGSTEKMVESVLAAYKGGVSINCETDLGDGLVSLDEAIPGNDNDTDLEESAYKKDMQSKMSSVFEMLQPRAKTVIELRFGLNGNEEHTLSQVANRIKCSEETVRKIQMDSYEEIRLRLKLRDIQHVLTGNRITANSAT